MRKALIWDLVFFILGTFLQLAAVLSYYASEHWIFSAFPNFKWFYFWGLLLCSIVFFQRRHLRLVALFSLSALFHVCLLSRPETAHLRILSLNARLQKVDPQAVAHNLSIQKPDYFALIEAEPQWKKTFDKEKLPFRYRSSVPMYKGRGLSFYSRWPLKKALLLHSQGKTSPIMSVVVQDSKGKELSFLVAQLPLPLTTQLRDQRAETLMALTKRAEQSTIPTWVVGTQTPMRFGPAVNAPEMRVAQVALPAATK